MQINRIIFILYYLELNKNLNLLSATLGALAAGTLLGWTSPASKTAIEKEYGFKVGEDEYGWIGSLMTIGAACVCLPIGILIDVLGRKMSMLLLVFPFTLGWALIIWATNIGMLYAGRYIVGVSGGAFCIAAPIYTGEIAEKEVRGSLGSYFQLMITIGILFVYAVGSGVNVYVLSIICGVIPLIFGGVFFFMPETPMYLVSRGKEQEAKKSIRRLRGNAFDVDSELITLQLEHQNNVANKLPITQAFTTTAAKKALTISMMLMFLQQVCGVNAVIFYTSKIFEDANSGISGSDGAIIVGVMQVVFTFIATLTVDRLGRRILLLISEIAMAICCILLGVYFYIAKDPSNKDTVNNLSWLPLFSLCVFIAAFALGFGPIPWMIIGELFPPGIKGIAGSISGTFNWILAFVVTKTFTLMSDDVPFWVYGGFSIAGIVYIFFFVPETKGKSLTQIQQMLGNDTNVKEPLPNDS